jgi:hypothetical protein
LTLCGSVSSFLGKEDPDSDPPLKMNADPYGYESRQYDKKQKKFEVKLNVNFS